MESEQNKVIPPLSMSKQTLNVLSSRLAPQWLTSLDCMEKYFRYALYSYELFKLCILSPKIISFSDKRDI